MNIPQERASQSVSKEITVVEAKRELEKNKIKRILFATGGSVALILVILGFFVPGLPCTPFALLSAALFAKSSDRLYNWLLKNRILGPRIRDYQRRRGVTKSGKVKVIVLMMIMVLISSFLIVSLPLLRMVILVSGLVGAIVVWFLVPEGREYPED